MRFNPLLLVLDNSFFPTLSHFSYDKFNERFWFLQEKFESKNTPPLFLIWITLKTNGIYEDLFIPQRVSHGRGIKKEKRWEIQGPKSYKYVGETD